MDTIHRNILEHFQHHVQGCQACAEAGGEQALCCPYGQQVLKEYVEAIREAGKVYLVRMAGMPWEDLTLALMGINEDQDDIWVSCLDMTISDRIEIMWILSERHWRESFKI